MKTSKVRYAVPAFDRSIFSAEKMFAFPMTAFKPGLFAPTVRQGTERCRRCQPNFGRIAASCATANRPEGPWRAGYFHALQDLLAKHGRFGPQV